MLLDFVRKPVGQFFSLLGLYTLSVVAPIQTVAAAMCLSMIQWKVVEAEPEAWWRMKFSILLCTAAVMAASSLSSNIWPLANFMLLLNMASTFRRPETRLEGLNGILGALLMIYAAIFGWEPVSESSISSFPLGWLWICAYTLWNNTFVTVRFPQSQTIAMLAAPFVVSLLQGPEYWLYARGSTLSLGVVIGMSLPRKKED